MDPKKKKIFKCFFGTSFTFIIGIHQRYLPKRSKIRIWSSHSYIPLFVLRRRIYLRFETRLEYTIKFSLRFGFISSLTTDGPERSSSCCFPHKRTHRHTETDTTQTYRYIYSHMYIYVYTYMVIFSRDM